MLNNTEKQKMPPSTNSVQSSENVKSGEKLNLPFGIDPAYYKHGVEDTLVVTQIFKPNGITRYCVRVSALQFYLVTRRKRIY